MSIKANGTWKALALTAIAALQGLCFWTLTEIRADIRTIQADGREVTRQMARTDSQLALIAARHLREDSTTKSPKTTP